MGIPESSLPGLIGKVKSWISFGASDPTYLSGGLGMDSNRTCCECKMKFTKSCQKFHCQICNRAFCGDCLQGNQSLDVVVSGCMEITKEADIGIISCKFCSDLSTWHTSARKYSDLIHPSDSPRQSPEPPSPNYSSDRFDGYSPIAAKSSFASFSSNPSSVFVRHSPSRSDDDEGEDSINEFLCPSSDCCHDTSSDIDSSSVSARHELHSFKSVGSSPNDSPSRIHFTSNRFGHSVQQEQMESQRSLNDSSFDQEVLRRVDKGTEDVGTTDGFGNNLSLFQSQFENNGLLWFPPPPEDEYDETENNFFTYDDDDDDEVGESGAAFSSSGSLANTFLLKEKQNGGHKEGIRDVVQGHFRALVSQLLEAEGVTSGKEGSAEDWLDIVTTIAWQAASFVKPDTSRGGSMDPVNYVKVKCVASGRPCDSTFIKGIVCTKNIKHKRMTSHYKNARLLLLGGALEYQKVPNQLASFNTLLQQERDHLKTVVSKIEAHRPNVLLVEKSVSSYAQEHLLAKEISLVLNVKRSLLERIARCTGAFITPSIDKIATSRLGHCELFYLEKVSEEHESSNQLNKKPTRTLMFFDGCTRRLGCTVLLKGCCREDLKKVKRVVQYAVFAAYHLSLETSFLTDEGASLPKMAIPYSISMQKIADRESATLSLEVGVPESLSQHHPSCSEDGVSGVLLSMHNGNLASSVSVDDLTSGEFIESRCHEQYRSQDTSCQEDGDPVEISECPTVERGNGTEASTEYYSAGDSHHSILVSYSSRCVLNDTLCERSRLLRIQFYGFFDKPLGRYLQDDLFGQASCRSCKEPTEAHVICYIHQHGNLTINVRRIPSVKLPGEQDEKIWMWHRCLRCAQVEGVPPATRRVLMSDAAWGLSFGKFLELSFSNHATANRVASCGHSLQRDCLRYYGSGSMVAIFRYSPINILSVRLPPSNLEFSSKAEQAWTRKEAAELLSKAKSLYAEISSAFHRIEEKSSSIGCEPYDMSELQNYMMEFKDLLMKEKDDYNDLLQPTDEGILDNVWETLDILEINRMRHSLIIASHVWDRRLYSMDSLLKSPTLEKASSTKLEKLRSDVSLKNGIIEQVPEENAPEFSKLEECHEKPRVSKDGPDHREDSMLTSFEDEKYQESESQVENVDNKSPSEFAPCSASFLSDKIDSAWTGINQSPKKMQLHASLQDVPETAPSRQLTQIEYLPVRKLRSPARVHSFDSVMRLQDRIRKGLPPSSLYLSTLRSFHASGDYRDMIRDPISTVQRTCSQLLPSEAQKLNPSLSSSTAFISHASLLPEGARLMVPQNGQNDVVIAIYDNEPTSIISYALSSKEYKDWINDNKPSVSEGGGWSFSNANKENSLVSKFSTWQPFGSLDLDYIHQVSYGSEDTSSAFSSFFSDPKSSPHLRISFGDESSNAGGKVKFSVTCYFAKQFDKLRKKCCPNELDFIRSLSRCRRWSAQGGKSNVYFAKSFDERFIIKQIQKTELDSFEEFGPEYFKYFTDSLSSGSPTCLAKVLGIFQVTVKYLKGGKDTKIDLIVMENLFYGRSISRVYDLKGSVRSRYNSDTKENKVLLDLNLLETLQTNPIFLGSKAKKCLERAVWNDTAFLASVDVMDYSLLVGVDEERKELVLGIIDFMRQYTWDKHLETWVKASGILGGPKNASPTVVSPKQYKKRFRKAMTTYFLTVPDQWSS